ncbi:MAG: DNA translocase FtsK 4TM domain-containing protein, partial [Rhodospirillales bacterium]|nr:DNA translocase FtsK 4TM domain-containing protein [Rhodospirillales bacterium]
YTPADPNWNRAAANAVANWAGTPGAYVADLALQSLGVGGGGFVLILLAWSWRIASHRGLPRVWIHLLLLPVTVLLGSVFAAGWPVPDTWPLKTGLGGFAGDTLFNEATGLLAQTGMTVSPPILIAVSGAAWLGCLMLTLGIDRGEWRGIGRNTLGAIRVGIFWSTQGAHFAARTAVRLWRSDLVSRVSGGRVGGASPPLHAPPRRTSPRPERPERRKEPRRSRKKLVDTAQATLTPSRRAAREAQPALDLGPAGEYQLPALGLLQATDPDDRAEAADPEALEQNARLLESVLDDFGVRGEIVKVRPGPVVTLYELEPAPGTKSSRVVGLADDIARSMSAISVRVAVVPGRSVIGIELPNANREMVGLRELLASESFEKTGGSLPLALGKDIGGAPICVDLARMPHLLIAGTTGSGKSVGMNAMILSLLYRLTPDQCKFIMIDPKMLELSVYDGIPHLLTPVVTDPSKAVVALKWTVREMEDRYRAMSQIGVRNIAGFNARLLEAQKNGETLTRNVQTGFDEEGKPVYEDQPIANEPLAHIVVVVDEMADLMLVAGKDVEAAIQRLAQMARAAGIHIIMATQRPSVDVITGTIKANFPTRVSFQVTSKIDSRTILGEQGAENLLGQGDMLYMAGGGRVTRIHGPFVSDEEVEHVVRYLQAQGEPQYIEAVTTDADFSMPGTDGGSNSDALYDQAVALVAREGKASTSFIQRHLQIGYNRAARIIEQMESEGVVSQANRVGRREVLIGNH